MIGTLPKTRAGAAGAHDLDVRHVVRRLAVGMYTACTFRLAQVLRMDFLMYVPGVFVYIALAAWLAALAGWATATAKGVRRGLSR